MKFSATTAKEGEYYYLSLPSGFKMIIKYKGLNTSNFMHYVSYNYWFPPFKGEQGAEGGKDEEDWSMSKIEPLDDITKIKILLLTENTN